MRLNLIQYNGFDYMDIDEYLRNFRRILPHSKYREKPSLAKAFFEYSRSIRLDFIEVFTTNIYPQYITISNKNYLLWDNHYWYLYEHFLSGIKLIISGDTDSLSGYDFFSGLGMLFMANKFEKNPPLSFVFSKYYVATGLAVPDYSLAKYEDNEYDKNIFIFSKIFAFFHEVSHHVFNNNKEIKLGIITEFEDITKALSGNFKKKEMNDVVKNLLEYASPKFLEEMSCDYYALENSMNFIFSLYKETDIDITGDSFNDVFTDDFLTSIRYILQFQTILYQLGKRYEYILSNDFKTNFLSDEDFILNTSAEVQGRLNYIFYLSSIVFMKKNIILIDKHPKYDFPSTEEFKIFKSAIDFLYNPHLINAIINDYNDIKTKRTNVEFIIAKNLLLNWIN